MSLLIVSKLSGVCFEVWFLFFFIWLAVSLPCSPMCEGTHWKATVLPCLLGSFIVRSTEYRYFNFHSSRNQGTETTSGTWSQFGWHQWQGRNNVVTVDGERGLWSSSAQSTDTVGMSFLAEGYTTCSSAHMHLTKMNRVGHINRTNSQQTCSGHHPLTLEERTTMLKST
jgi:hypothetical protein